MAIGTVKVSDTLDSRWGIKAVDYVYQNRRMDLQDLLVRVSIDRAIGIEACIVPLSTRMRRSNRILERLGALLGRFSNLQTQFGPDDKSTKPLVPGLSKDETELLIYAGVGNTSGSYTRAQTEEVVQRLKNKMDSYNNEAQLRMVRLQGSVERRDNAFTTASTLMENVSGTRKNLIASLS